MRCGAGQFWKIQIWHAECAWKRQGIYVVWQCERSCGNELQKQQKKYFCFSINKKPWRQQERLIYGLDTGVSKFNSEPKLKLSLQKEHSTKLNYVVLHSFTFSAFTRHLSTNSLLTYHANKQCTLSHSNTPTCIDTSLSPKGALSRHIWFSIFKRGLCAVTEGLFSRPPNNNTLAYYPISKIELGSIDPK